MDPKTDDPPPSYSTCTSDGPNTGINTARLRRFLSFCLAIDYGLDQESPDMLTKSEWHHIVRLSQLCFDDFCQNQPPTSQLLYLWPTLPTNKTIVEEILEPAEVLGICPRRALHMTRVFISSMNWATGYDSDPQFCFHVTGRMKDLAEKLTYDLEELFQKLLPRDDHMFKVKMLRAHGAISRKYFAKLESGSLRLTPRAFWIEMHESRTEPRWVALGAAKKEYAAIADTAELLCTSESQMRELSWWRRYRWRRAKRKEPYLYILDDSGTKEDV